MQNFHMVEVEVKSHSSHNEMCKTRKNQYREWVNDCMNGRLAC